MAIFGPIWGEFCSDEDYSGFVSQAVRNAFGSRAAISFPEGGGEGVVLRHSTTHRGIKTCADKCRNRGSSPTVLRPKSDYERLHTGLVPAIELCLRQFVSGLAQWETNLRVRRFTLMPGKGRTTHERSPSSA